MRTPWVSNVDVNTTHRPTISLYNDYLTLRTKRMNEPIQYKHWIHL